MSKLSEIKLHIDSISKIADLDDTLEYSSIIEAIALSSKDNELLQEVILYGDEYFQSSVSRNNFINEESIRFLIKESYPSVISNLLSLKKINENMFEEVFAKCLTYKFLVKCDYGAVLVNYHLTKDSHLLRLEKTLRDLNVQYLSVIFQNCKSMPEELADRLTEEKLDYRILSFCSKKYLKSRLSKTPTDHHMNALYIKKAGLESFK